MGNVHAVVSDARSIDGTSVTPTVLSLNDYYPFGWGLTGMSFNSEEYRYGFQGQEHDTETGLVNYRFRMHDARIGRFFAVDPLEKKYPWNSPYAFSENRVVDAFELEGLEKVRFNVEGSSSEYEEVDMTGWSNDEMKNAFESRGYRYDDSWHNPNASSEEIWDVNQRRWDADGSGPAKSWYAGTSIYKYQNGISHKHKLNYDQGKATSWDPREIMASNEIALRRPFEKFSMGAYTSVAVPGTGGLVALKYTWDLSATTESQVKPGFTVTLIYNYMGNQLEAGITAMDLQWNKDQKVSMTIGAGVKYKLLKAELNTKSFSIGLSWTKKNVNSVKLATWFVEGYTGGPLTGKVGSLLSTYAKGTKVKPILTLGFEVDITKEYKAVGLGNPEMLMNQVQGDFMKGLDQLNSLIIQELGIE